MIVDRRTRYAAMLRVFRSARIGGGAVVHGADIEREWCKITGLRRADLDSALHEMIDRRYLIVHGGGNHRDYELTVSGRRDFLWREALLEIRDWLILTWVRARATLTLVQGRQLGPPAHDRRLPH